MFNLLNQCHYNIINLIIIWCWVNLEHQDIIDHYQTKEIWDQQYKEQKDKSQNFRHNQYYTGNKIEMAYSPTVSMTCPNPLQPDQSNDYEM